MRAFDAWGICNMDRNTLLALAERCEKANGPDRELDVDVWLACVSGATRKRTSYIHGFTGRECVLDETRENGRLIVVRAYTDSLDAPFSLIGGDEYWRVGNDGDGADPSTFKATVTSHDDQSDINFHDAHAATAPLALCAAALRARAGEA